MYQTINMQLLEKDNALYRNLQFTLQNIYKKKEVSFLDMKIRVSKENKIPYKCYRKPADKPDKPPHF